MIIGDWPDGWYDKKKDSFTLSESINISKNRLILQHFDDKELIDEMKMRGYVVPKKDYVVKFSTNATVQNWILQELKDDLNYLDHLKRQSAYELVDHMLKPGITKQEEFYDSRAPYYDTTQYRTTLTVIIDNLEKYNEDRQNDRRSKQDEVSGDT